MFVVRLLLFFVLLYNTEALLAENDGDYDWYQTTTSIPDTTSIGTKGSKSFAVKNKYRYSVSPGEATNTPISKSIRMYSGETTIKPIAGDDDKPTNHTATNDSYSVTTEREYSRNTKAPDFWYSRTAEDSETTTVKIAHDSYRGSVGAITLENGILTAYLPDTSSAEEKTTTEAATTPKTPFDLWSYKYGSTTAKSRYYNPYDRQYLRPYRPYRPYPFDPITTTATNYWYPTTAKDSETTYPMKTIKDFWYALRAKAKTAIETIPYYWHKRWREYSSTTPKPRTTAVTRATTTTDSWYDTTSKPSPWDRRWREYSSTTPKTRTTAVTRGTTTTDSWYDTTTKPSRWHRRWREYSSTTPKTRTTAVTRGTTTTDSWYDTTTKPSRWHRRWREYSSTTPKTRTTAVTRGTTTTDSWYDTTTKPSPWDRRWREYSSTTPKPRTTAVTRGTTTTDSWYDTTSKPSPWDRRWREYSSTIPTPEYNTRYPRTNVTRATTTTDTYKYNTIKPTDTWYPTTTTDTYKYNTDKTTDTTDQANRTTPASPCKSCNPVNISNSSINTNYYGQLVDLLKKIAGNILPSTINIAPNSNFTHLTVVSGNENTFIYVNN